MNLHSANSIYHSSRQGVFSNSTKPTEHETHDERHQFLSLHDDQLHQDFQVLSAGCVGKRFARVDKRTLD